MNDLLAFLFSPWGWLTLGVLFAVLEILLPGAFMLWLAGAALATAGHVALFDLGVGGQLAVFAGWTVAMLAVGRRVKREAPIASDNEQLNRRGEQLVGAVGTVSQPIVHGQGKVELGDTAWLARGPDCAAGTLVRVVSVDGALLRVLPAETAALEVSPPAG
jgi:hypothetical protein